MKTSDPALFLIFAASFGALASDREFSYRPASVRYATYGNSLGDPTAPSTSDRNIAFEVKGHAAREMFEAIGPDRKDTCAQVSDVRFRSRDNEKLVCTKSSQGVHACYFGFDLKSGKSVGGSIC